MKKNLLFIVVLMLLGSANIVHAQAMGDLVFTGGTSTDWNTAGNWSVSDGAGGYSALSTAVPGNTKNVWIPVGKTANISNTAYALNLMVNGTLTTASTAKKLVMGTNNSMSVLTNNGTISDGNLQLEIMRYASKLTITGTPLTASKFREIKMDDISSYANGASQEMVLDIDATVSFTSLENFSATATGTRIFTINAGKTLTLAASGYFGWYTTATTTSNISGSVTNTNDQEAWVYNINGILDASTNDGRIILLTNLNPNVITNKTTVNIGSTGIVKCGAYVCFREGSTSNTITVNNNGLITYKGTSYNTDRTDIGNATFTQINNSLLATTNKNVTFTSATDVSLAHNTAAVGGDFNINGSLAQAAKLILGTANLNITGSGSIVAPSATKYIVENSTGRLSMFCAANTSVIFPIGSTASVYMPAVLKTSSNANIKAFASATITYAPVDPTKANTTEWRFISDVDVNVLMALTPASATNSTNPVIGTYAGGTWSEQTAMYASGTFTGATPVAMTAAAIVYAQTGSMGAFTSSGVSSDATLSDLRIDGITVSGFSPATLTYTYRITNRASTIVPTVTFVKTSTNAAAIQVNATAIPGTTTVKVTAQDGTTVKTYALNFDYLYGTDATLSDLKVDGTTITGFSASKMMYKLWVPAGTTTVPTVTGTARDPYARSVSVLAASSMPDTTTITVTADDNTTAKTYKVIFNVIAVATNVLNHPSIPFNIADLDRMKANRNVEPWRTGYQALANSSQASLTYNMQGPYDTVGRETNFNLTQYQNDGTAVLYQAIQYYMTGNTSYADKAIQILEAWTTTHTSWSGSTPFLAGSDYGLNYIMGAEILRHTYSGWTLLNSAHCEDYFKNMLWPLFNVPNPLRAANQGAAQLKGAMAVAIFCNDTIKLNQVINLYKNDACGGISNTLSNGETGDAGRDQPHSLGMIGNLATVAEMAWRQNLDLFAVLDNRLLAIMEYYSSYNLGNTVPWINFGTCYGYYTSVGASGRGTNWTLVNELIYGHYAVRKGLNTTYLGSLRSLEPVDADLFMYRKDVDTSSANPVVPPLPDFVTDIKVESLTGIDIGTCNYPGSNSYSNGTWTISGSGTDIKGNAAAESFRFAYKQVIGNTSLVGKISYIDNIHQWAKGGLMFRESLTNTSKMIAVYMMPGTGEGAEATWRGATASYGSYTQKDNLALMPVWLKINRRDNLFSAYISPDSVSWTPIANAVIPMSDTFYIGLAVDAYTNNYLCTATLSQVKTNQSAGAIILPIHLSSFEAKATASCNIALNWNATSDDKNHTFIIERSADGSKFEVIGNVVSDRISTLLIQYNFVDTKPVTGSNYYRIADAGYDGTKHYTNVRTVALNCNTPIVQLFPNPVIDKVTINGMKRGNKLIRILNVVGNQVLAEKTMDVVKQLDITHLPPGNYHLQVLTNNEVSYTGKFVKMP